MLLNERSKSLKISDSSKKLKRVWCVGEKPMSFAKLVSDDITVIELEDEDVIAKK